jgi:hypothetical protein
MRRQRDAASNRERLKAERLAPIEANKNQSVDGAEGLFLRSSSPQNVYLLPQRQNFRLERCPRPKQIYDHPNNELPDPRLVEQLLRKVVGHPHAAVRCRIPGQRPAVQRDAVPGEATILMVRLNDGAEILVRRNGTAPVSALAWNAKGTLLAFAAEDGDAGLLEL